MNKYVSPSMLLMTGNWGPVKTFRMIPTTQDCPYVECIYNPALKVLAIIGTISKESFHSVEKIDDNGDPVRRKVVTEEGKEYKTKNVLMETFSEYYMQGTDEIRNFLKMFAVNYEDFEEMVEEYLNMATMEDPSTSGILTGPQMDTEAPKIITE